MQVTKTSLGALGSGQLGGLDQRAKNVWVRLARGEALKQDLTPQICQSLRRAATPDLLSALPPIWLAESDAPAAVASLKKRFVQPPNSTLHDIRIQAPVSTLIHPSQRSPAQLKFTATVIQVNSSKWRPFKIEGNVHHDGSGLAYRFLPNVAVAMGPPPLDQRAARASIGAPLSISRIRKQPAKQGRRPHKPI
jgi:hypothetical protein